jgi:hypothetical protein
VKGESVTTAIVLLLIAAFLIWGVLVALGVLP